jgi:DNA-binding transcriptional LysR family regulator
MLNLNLLEVFEAVVRTRSYSQAAKELGLPKSSASRAISRLEADLGVQLVFRTTRQVAPSPAGTALYDRLAPLLDSMEGALKDIPEQQVLPSGVLRVTAPVDLGVVLLAEVVTRYTARYPAVKVELHLTGRLVDLVREGFDVALRVGTKLTDSTLKARKVAAVSMKLYASPVYLARKGTPRNEDDFEAHDWVEFQPTRERLHVRGAQAPKARVSCDDFYFVRGALLAGAGLGLLPELLASGDVIAGTLVPVLPKYERPAGHLHLVTPANRLVPRKVTAFAELVREVFQSRALPPA